MATKKNLEEGIFDSCFDTCVNLFARMPSSAHCTFIDAGEDYLH
jgi:hypothetical protein